MWFLFLFWNGEYKCLSSRLDAFSLYSAGQACFYSKTEKLFMAMAFFWEQEDKEKHLLARLAYDNPLTNGSFTKHLSVHLSEIEVIFAMCMIASVGAPGHWRFFAFYFVDLWGNGLQSLRHRL